MASRIAVIEDHGLIAHTLAAALQARAVDVPVVMVTGVSDRMVATDARRTLTEPVLSRQWSPTYHG